MPADVSVRRRPRLRRTTAVLVAAMGATLVIAARATATPPITTETSFHDTRTNFIDCGSFSLTGDWDITRRTTTFLDDGGTPTGLTLHIRFDGTLTHNGRSVRDNGSFHRTIDLSDGSITVTGGFRVITAPKQGVLLHQTGRGILLGGAGVFGAGPNEWNNQQFGALCAYFAS